MNFGNLILGGTFIFGIVLPLMFVLGIPPAEISENFERFQTGITGFFATAAAVGTVYVVYIAAVLPLKHTKAEREQVRLKDQIAGAVVLTAAVTKWMNDISLAASKERRFPDPPTTLTDFNLIRTQSTTVGKLLYNLVASHDELWTIRKIPGGADRGKKIDDLHQEFNAAYDLLITELAPTAAGTHKDQIRIEKSINSLIDN